MDYTILSSKIYRYMYVQSIGSICEKLILNGTINREYNYQMLRG